jgi:hypothetical protein
MNDKIKLELTASQFSALAQCMLGIESGYCADFDKELMARFLLGRVLKKMINRFQDLKKQNKISLNKAEAAAFRTIMSEHIDRCGVYEQTIIREILTQIGTKL